MQILPSDLLPHSSARYVHDLVYREDVDHERMGERAQRLTLLFHGVDLFESSPSFELSPLPQ